MYIGAWKSSNRNCGYPSPKPTCRVPPSAEGTVEL